MYLTPGNPVCDASSGRGADSERPRYRVTRLAREGRWHALYEGKKALRNFHFGRRALDDAPEDECLDVWLRTLIYPQLDPEYVRLRRAHARFEATRVLACRKTGLLPEPLDYLRLPNTQDPFRAANFGERQLARHEPVLVLARVHGDPLSRWPAERLTPLPPERRLTRALRVLAELLDFVARMHAEGFLLAGLGPDAVCADELDRLHYLATDLVLDAARQQEQRRLFPPERYPAPFAAPEALLPGRPLDPGADLYSWSALACFLLTGQAPGPAGPGAEVFGRLTQELAALSGAAVQRVQRSFQIAGGRFAATWPDGFVAGLRHCLEPDPTRRPESRVALCRRWSAAPPRPVSAALAVRSAEGVQLLLSGRGLEPGLDVVVRRGPTNPQAPDEGEAVVDAPLQARCEFPVDGAPAGYAVFTRARGDEGPLYSQGVDTPLLDPADPATLTAFAEGLPDQGPGGAVPEQVELLAELPDPLPVARAWLDCGRPAVRTWALLLLGRRRAEPAARDLLLRRGLADSCPELRRAAARALFGDGRRPPLGLLLEVAGALGADLDARIQGLRGLAECVDADVLAAAESVLEGARLLPCPECREPIPAAERDEHLRERHGHVDLDGTLLPLGLALQRLWARLFSTRAEEDARRLAELFEERRGEVASTAYRTAFEAQLERHSAGLGQPGTDSAPAPAWAELAGCLAAHPLTQRVCRGLVASGSSPLRHLARLALVPVVARRLAGAVDLDAFRTSVEALCPGEPPETRLAVCRNLAAAGASATAAAALARELEPECPQRCPSCTLILRRRDLGEHLRSAHQIHEIGLERIEREEVLARLADARRPVPERQRLLRAVLAAPGTQPLREDAVAAFTAGLGSPFAALSALDELEGQGAPSGPIEEGRRRLLSSTRVSCPQCQAALGLAGAEVHLWQEHRLVLRGDHCRPAWEVIEGCLAHFAADADEAHLRRGLELARRDDPQAGPLRFARLARERGLRHPLIGQILARLAPHEVTPAPLRWLALAVAVGGMLVLVGLLLAWLLG